MRDLLPPARGFHERIAGELLRLIAEHARDAGRGVPASQQSEILRRKEVGRLLQKLTEAARSAREV